MSIEQILTNTPPWVFVVLAYLVWQGTMALQQRTLPLWRVLMVPALFIALGVSRIVGSASTLADSLLPWAIALVVFMPLAFVTGPRLLAVDRRTREVTTPGSPAPLVRNVLVFTLQFAVAVMTRAGTRGSQEAMLAAHVISGATAGYFIGWMIVALRHYFTTENSGGLGQAAGSPDRSSVRPASSNSLPRNTL